MKNKKPADGAGAAAKIAKARRLSGKVVLEGLHAIKHARRFGAVFEVIISCDGPLAIELAGELAPDILPWLEKNLILVSEEEMALGFKKIPETKIAAIADKPKPKPLSWFNKTNTPVIMIERPTHLGNLGSIIRTSAAAGAACVLTLDGVDPWHAHALRGSAGLHFALPVARFESCLSLLPPIWVADDKGESLKTGEIPDHCTLIFGSERHGVSDRLKSKARRCFSLPMTDGVSSLNVAATVAATVYHWRLFRRITEPQRLLRNELDPFP